MSYQYINTEKELEVVVKKLSNCTEFAIDLEFDKNRFRYGFNLCLMQIFTGEECFLIDPLSLNITKIFPVLENPAISKICFSFSEDLRLLHLLGCKPKGLYDLKIASSLLNFPPTSLNALLSQILEIEIDKGSQQSNWFNRPLSKEQLQYAANDVLYLLKLKNVLQRNIEERKMQDWVKQENEWVEASDYSQENHKSVLKEKDKKGFSEYDWHIYSKLIELREEKAEELNRPSFKVLDKNWIQKIVRQPDSIRDWLTQKGIHPTLKNRSTKDEFDRVLKNAISEADTSGLSKKKKAFNTLSRTEYHEMQQFQRALKKAKKEFFSPLQKLMKEELGEYAQTFILNNRLIQELFEGDHKSIVPYKKRLIDHFSSELGLSLSDFNYSKPDIL